MKKTILCIAALMVTVASFAQISTGEPNASVLPRIGNRPVKGDCGLYLGGSVSQVMDLVDAIKDDNKVWYGIPIVNFKYYCTDALEFRIGFQFSANTAKFNGTIDEEEIFSPVELKRFEGADYTRIRPGLAYHFSTKNILDVYVGADLPIGFNLDKTKVTYSDDSSSEESQNTFVLGAGLFIGLQVFVADLPFAIGLETGFSGLLNMGNKVKHKEIDAVGQEYIYYTGAQEGVQYQKLNNVTSHWGADAALTFSYYFNNKK